MIYYTVQVPQHGGMFIVLFHFNQTIIRPEIQCLNEYDIFYVIMN